MKLIKALFAIVRVTVKTVISYIVSPFQVLIKANKETTALTIGVAVVGAAARIIYVASKFVAVPALLVTLAKIWLIGGLILAAIALISLLFAGVIGLSALWAMKSKEAEANFATA